MAKFTLENVKLFFEEGKLPNEICYKCSEEDCAKKMGRNFNDCLNIAIHYSGVPW
jgi:hypothetical protein